jgi:hypothetical protein
MAQLASKETRGTQSAFRKNRARHQKPANHPACTATGLRSENIPFQ